MPDSSGRLIGLSIIFLAGAVLMLNGHPGNTAMGGIVVVVAGILFAVELWHSRPSRP